MTGPPVSCLCVTENRTAFLPWLLWSFQRQTWPCCELVIVSGSGVPQDIARAPGVRVVEVPPSTSVPIKRSVALKAAASSIIEWFDDDDWQHPQRLSRLVTALTEDITFAGWASAWFVDLHRRRCERYPPAQRALFNGAGFRTSVARRVRFDAAVRLASDSQVAARVADLGSPVGAAQRRRRLLLVVPRRQPQQPGPPPTVPRRSSATR